jgi:NTE family protein
MKRFGISFKGGLARGFGAIGIIRFFQEENLKPQVLAGSSSGSIMAAAFALGLDWKEILKISTSIRFREIISFISIFTEGSIVSSDKFYNKLSEVQSDIDIKDLPIKLIIYATDTKNYQRVNIEEGSLLNALMTSSSFPAVFPFRKLKNYKRTQLVDGDLTMGYSAKPLRENGAEIVFGVGHTNNHKINASKENILERIFLPQSLLLKEIELLHNTLDPVDLEIKYNVGNYSPIDFKNISLIAENAYRAIRKEKDLIYKLLEL